MDVTLVANTTIQITLPLADPASVFHSLLLAHYDYRIIFNKLRSATRYLRRTRIHFDLLVNLLLDLCTVPIFLLVLVHFRFLSNVVTSANLGLNLLDGACHLFDVHLGLIFTLLLKSITISLLLVKILTLISISPDIFLDRLTIFGSFS